MEQSIVRKKLLEYLEETKMSKYKFAQRSGISLSTIYDIIRKEDYDIRESNIIKIWQPPWSVFYLSMQHRSRGEGHAYE